MTTEQIAAALHMSVKNVQSYIPYSKGMYGGESPDSARSADYRKRKQAALAAQHSKGKERKQEENTSVENISNIIREPDFQEDNTFILDKKNETEESKKEMNGIEQQEEKDKMKTSKGKKNKNQEADALNKIKEISPVYRLQIALDLDPEDADKLRALGKCENGISREILVSGDITLHALHYAIMRLFGFNNGHLHSYRLPSEVFQALTGSSFLQWASMCGMYFRFPDGNYGDQYWDDDYDESVSVRTWFRNKYRKVSPLGAVGETYCMGQKAVRELILETPSVRVRPPFHLWVEIKNLPDVEKSINDVSVEELERTIVFEGSFEELAEKIRIKDLLIPRKPSAAGEDFFARIFREIIRMQMDMNLYPEEYAVMIQYGEEARDALEYYNRLDQAAYFHKEDVIKAYGSNYEETIEYFRKESRRKLKKYYNLRDDKEPKLFPITDTLHYAYDYGDGWTFTITCLEICNEGDLYDKVQKNGGPVCIGKDGGMLIDDVGGIGGYIDFLQKVFGQLGSDQKHTDESVGEYNDEYDDEYDDEASDDPTDDPEYLLNWAKGMGWTGREISLERML